MGLVQAILLGLIQGLTEFIPISSTAHMTIAAKLFGAIQNNEQWTSFMAVVQLGTLVSVFFYFGNDIKHILTSMWADNITARKPFAQQSDNSRLGWLIAIGSVPIIVIGLALKKIIEGDATKDITLIATMLIVVSVLLFIAEKVAKQVRTMENVTWRDAVLIGASQALALMPGSSRSGTTITAGLFLGLTRETAARFSFLLSIPAITGSGLLELVKTMKHINTGDLMSLTIATFVAGISGYYSIAFLMKYLRTNSTFIFIAYRVVLAVVLLLFMR
ncbi:MAG: undecaprenyl-diphosphatase UppP [Candidatus Kapabacteria bacterium]|nr:undecaprenyl-diphosphatase UppP [Candidatus Kapabacteria bacterium]